jgi:hypothetical protein
MRVVADPLGSVVQFGGAPVHRRLPANPSKCCKFVLMGSQYRLERGVEPDQMRRSPPRRRLPFTRDLTGSLLSLSNQPPIFGSSPWTLRLT